MTKKIDKKTRLDAMLQMWIVLREIYKTRSWQVNSPDFKLMAGLQVELSKTLGISTESRYLCKAEIEALIENLKKLKIQLEAGNIEIAPVESVIQLLQQSIDKILIPASCEDKEVPSLE